MNNINSYWETVRAAGEPHSVIRVRNLQTSLKIAKDAWGRQQKSQPALISVSVSLRKSFGSASLEDSVTGSTIHYGILSAAILKFCDSWNESAENKESIQDRSLASYLNGISAWLTGTSKATLPISMMNCLEIKVMLPKASLIGGGASLTNFSLYEGEARFPPNHARLLALHDLRIPTIIGVNPNERQAKQIVIGNIQIDPFPFNEDLYNELEQVIVKTIDESSFQTLEALATHLGHRIIQFFIVPLHGQLRETRFPRIRICLEKPTAVTFADAPMIEMLADSDPKSEDAVKRLWDENPWRVKPPFPLQGKLDEWISSDRESRSNLVD